MKVQSRKTLKLSLIYPPPYKVATAVLLFVIFFLVSFTRAQAPLTIAWKDTQLSVSAEKVPLAQILREVAHQTGLEIRGLEGLHNEVSLRFSALPLRPGLQTTSSSSELLYGRENDPCRRRTARSLSDYWVAKNILCRHGRQPGRRQAGRTWRRRRLAAACP